MKSLVSSSSQVLMSGHALRRMDQWRLSPWQVVDSLAYGRALEIESGRDDFLAGIKKYGIWNFALGQSMTTVVAPDHCIITMYPTRHFFLGKDRVRSISHLSRSPYFLPELSLSMSSKFEVSVLAQERGAPRFACPNTFVASRICKSNKTPQVLQLLRSRCLKKMVTSICNEELEGLIPIDIRIGDGVKIPLSAVFERQDHQGRTILPWTSRRD